MKKLLFSLALLVLLNQNQFAQTVITAKYKPISYGQMKSAADNANELHRQREKYLDELVDKALSLKPSNSDNMLISQFDSIYKQLKEYYKKPLAYEETYQELKSYELKMKELISQYNRRSSVETVKPIIKKETSSKEIQFYGGEVEVYGSSPIYGLPDLDSNVVCYASNGKVKLISKSNGNFYLVDYNGKKGYLSSTWIKK